VPTSLATESQILGSGVETRQNEPKGLRGAHHKAGAQASGWDVGG
jgi:hypothetical protein